MKRSDRLFRIVELLRARSFVTAEVLASELHVSKRTIYRDIRDLQSSGIPIRGEAGIGYQLQAKYDLPPLTLTAQEIQALVGGARLIASWGDDELGAAAEGLLHKVEAVLPGSLKRLLADTPIFAHRQRWAEVTSAELGPLRAAILAHKRVRLVYEGANKPAGERAVRPVGLWFWGRVWSLAAWCELREDWRNFRTDRMREVEVLDSRFDGEEISLDGFVAAMRAQG